MVYLDITDVIPTGRENAVSRHALCGITGLSERAVREAIQAVNESGEAIICCENGKGYFLPETQAEAERYIRYSQSYLISLARKDRGMRRAVKRMFSDQLELDI